jgi:hypothetical protein
MGGPWQTDDKDTASRIIRMQGMRMEKNVGSWERCEEIRNMDNLWIDE